MLADVSPSLPTPATRAGRAPALPPGERRRAIIDAVVPLLVEHGAEVTTRELAEAAGVAEGTLFRVFEDKTALLHAAAHAVLDPEPLRHALSDVDRALTLEAMVHEAVGLLLERISRVMPVLMALRGSPGAPGVSGPRGAHGPPAFIQESHRVLLESLTELFDRYRAELRVEPQRAALTLRALVFGSRAPWAASCAASVALTAQEISATVVAGIRACPQTGEGSC